MPPSPISPASFLKGYWMAVATYEFGHKLFALGGDKVRVRKPDWHACINPKPSELERSRPMVFSERILATATAMFMAPVMAPFHLTRDLVEAELKLRGMSPKETQYIFSWEGALFL